MTAADLKVTEVTMATTRPDYSLLASALLDRILELDKDPAIEAEYQEWLKERKEKHESLK